MPNKPKGRSVGTAGSQLGDCHSWEVNLIIINIPRRERAFKIPETYPRYKGGVQITAIFFF